MTVAGNMGGASALPAFAALEPRSAGLDLRPVLTALGAIRKPLPAFADPMRTAALATLAEAASHWVEADDLAFTQDPDDAVIGALNASRDRISSESAAIAAETREGLRSKAQIITRLHGPALRDDASMTDAGLALLRSLMEDLTREA